MGVPEKTLITGEEILEYIPQRPPVVMVDTFYGIDERGCARSGLTVTADNLFVADGVLDECGIVEHIAQSAALRAGYMNRTMGRRVQLGYIGSRTDIQCIFARLVACVGRKGQRAGLWIAVHHLVVGAHRRVVVHFRLEECHGSQTHAGCNQRTQH